MKYLKYVVNLRVDACVRGVENFNPKRLFPADLLCQDIFNFKMHPIFGKIQEQIYFKLSFLKNSIIPKKIREKFSRQMLTYICRVTLAKAYLY